MSVYLIPLQSALLLFPFLAAMITLPYIIIHIENTDRYYRFVY